MQTSHPITILLAEDDSDDRILFREAVKTLHVNIDIIEAESGVQTIDILQQSEELPDVIVVDINMPLISGIDCVKIIREDVRLSEIPVVVMSTSGNDVSVAEAKKAGADRYAIKPPSFEDLTKIVRIICSVNLKEAAAEYFVLNKFVDGQKVHTQSL